jgi:hypothetical protein
MDNDSPAPREQPKINPELEKIGRARLGKILDALSAELESKEAPSTKRRIAENIICSLVATGIAVLIGLMVGGVVAVASWAMTRFS